MWSKLLLFFLVNWAYAAKNPGWKANTEYEYRIEGRTLASLEDANNQHSGVFMKAKLNVIATPNGNKLKCQLSDVKYAQIHTNLKKGWDSEIPDSELSYKNMPCSGKPFMLVLEDGVVTDVMVERDVTNWEANLIKSIASQFQLDTNAKNRIESKINVLPEPDRNDAVFKSMEETVTGTTETLYEIHPLPEHILQTEPWLVPKENLIADGQVIEVIKHKNFTNSEERPSYHFGFGGVKNWEPTSNQIEDFFARTSTCRVILTGKLQRYTIQSSYSVDKIVVSPNLYEKEKGSIVSMLNATLIDVRTETSNVPDLSSPISLGNLVYTYINPFESSNEARSKRMTMKLSSEEDSQERNLRSDYLRFPRSLQDIQKLRDDQPEFREVYSQQVQPKPELTDAPQSPLLPYTMGYHGSSIKQERSFNLQENIENAAKEIGRELQQPNKVAERGTLSKFVILSSLIRLCNAKEIKQCAQNLYTQEQQGPRRAAWVAFRDAVAECGTGPALVAVNDWIETKKISGEEAAEVVSALARSTRIPTEQYMKAFFEMITNPQVQSQESLNETSLFAYTNLLRSVYVDRKMSRRQFPIHSFGTFNTPEGRIYLNQTVIPHLKQKLNEAIERDDVRRIHVYIRALGNTGHQNMLQVFEPYLEGKRQCSQFQRLLMVMSMDKLAVTSPAVAGTVLFKIYQNTGERQEVRVAAVYQLMRASPPTDILQRMAEYTNIDVHEHVNAAVKECIKSLCKMEGKRFEYLRSSAKAAKPLLTPKVYGKHNAVDYIRNKVVEELNLEVKQSLQTIGSDDSFVPKSIRYSLASHLGGVKRHLIDAEAMISSVDQLVSILYEQTDAHYKAKQQKQQSSTGKYSSENIARLLNLDREELEQLEGSMYMEMGALQKMWSFDNHTIERMPEAIREHEESLRRGKTINYLKLSNPGAMTLSFPTGMGFPFVFTYDAATLTQVEGTIKATANPSVLENNRLRRPDSLTAKINVHMTGGAKIQSHLTFVTPFDHQHYLCGVDKNLHVHVPVDVQMEIDLNKVQAKVEVTPTQEPSESVSVHYSLWPFTSRSDILTIVPVALRPNTHHIRQEKSQSFDRVFGKQHTGVAIRVWGNHPYVSTDVMKLGHMIREYDLLTAVKYLWEKSPLIQSELNLQHMPQQSSTNKIIIQAKQKSTYKSQPHSGFHDKFYTLEELSQMKSGDAEVRQEKYCQAAGTGINNCIVKSGDYSIEFQGQKEIKHSLTIASAKSNIDPKSRFIAYYENLVESHPFKMAIEIKNRIPNVNGLDIEYALNHQPEQEHEIQLAYAKSGEEPTKITAKINLNRTEDRKQYLKEHQLYKQCKQETLAGKQASTCVRAMIQCNKLNEARIEISHNIEENKYSSVRDLFHAIRTFYYPMVHVHDSQGAGKNKILATITMEPELNAFNATIKGPEQKTEIQNIQVGEWIREILVPHPVYHLRSRVYGKLTGAEGYRHSCVICENSVNTFDNKTYRASFGEQWTIISQYSPKTARRNIRNEKVEEQLQQQIENYAVLLRKSQSGEKKKDVMITLSTNETTSKYIEILLTPSGKSSDDEPKGIVAVNGQQITLQTDKSYDLDDGYIQIYQLPNGEVKMEIKDVFYILYDGEAVRMSATNGEKLRDSIVGICGNFNDDKSDEFRTPANCIAKDTRKFVESFKLDKTQRVTELTGEECRPKVSPMYVNVISAGRNENESGPSGNCVKYQTRYIKQGGETCFTLRPVPVCSCSKHVTVRKTVAVHCIRSNESTESGNLADMWTKLIDNGANPLFVHKPQTATVQMDLPTQCRN